MTEINPAHEHIHLVSYAECTVGNHVYYSRYLDFLEAARGELFRAVGWPLNRLCQEGFLFPVTEITMRYKRPARYDDRLRILTRIIRLTLIRVEFSYQILRNPGSELLVEATTVHVCVSTGDQPKKMPQETFNALRQYSSIVKD